MRMHWTIYVYGTENLMTGKAFVSKANIDVTEYFIESRSYRYGYSSPEGVKIAVNRTA